MILSIKSRIAAAPQMKMLSRIAGREIVHFVFANVRFLIRVNKCACPKKVDTNQLNMLSLLTIGK